MSDVKAWIKRLHQGAFANLGGARKSIGKARFSAAEKERAMSEAAAYFSVRSQLAAQGNPATPAQLKAAETDARFRAIEIIKTVHMASEAMKWLKEVYPDLQTSDAQMVLDSMLAPALAVLAGELPEEALPVIRLSQASTPHGGGDHMQQVGGNNGKNKIFTDGPVALPPG